MLRGVDVCNGKEPRGGGGVAIACVIQAGNEKLGREKEKKGTRSEEAKTHEEGEGGSYSRK